MQQGPCYACHIYLYIYNITLSISYLTQAFPKAVSVQNKTYQYYFSKNIRQGPWDGQDSIFNHLCTHTCGLYLGCGHFRIKASSGTVVLLLDSEKSVRYYCANMSCTPTKQGTGHAGLFLNMGQKVGIRSLYHSSICAESLDLAAI